MYTVYILYSAKLDKYYIGYSSDVQARLRKHNNASRGFTNAGRPWSLVFMENFDRKRDASHREKQLKAWKNRTRIEDLIIKGS